MKIDYTDLFYVIVWGVFDYFVLKWTIFHTLLSMCVLFLLIQGVKKLYKR